MRRLLLVGLVALALGLASCQALGQSLPGSSAPSPAAQTPDSGLTPSPAATATPAASPTPSTPTATPTITPTPTATPTPIPPGPAVASAAGDLSKQLAAFRSALNSKDVDALAKAQLALLDSADKAEQALKDDKSPQANMLREVIQDIRAGAAGQTQLLDTAARLLPAATGASASGTPTASAPGMDPASLAGDLRRRLEAYQQARREGNAGNLLSRQKDLVDTLDQIAQATQGSNAPDAQQLRSAAAGLRQALGGSSQDLAAALAKAQAAVGATSDQAPQNVDLRAEAGALQARANALKAAIASGNSGDLARTQRDLLDEIARAQASASSAGAPPADSRTLQAALSGLRDGASGDTAKLDGAISQLAGLSGTGSAAGAGQAAAPVDLKQAAQALQGKVEDLQRAIDSGNAGDQLRLQRALYEEVAKDAPGLQGVSSPQADALRSAIDSINHALGGDQGKLDDAAAKLALVAGGSTARTPATPGANADLAPIASALGHSLDALARATQGGDPDAAAKARQDLQAAAARADDALQGVRSERADALRAAITAAREAASGDPTKVKAAQDALKAAGQ